MIEALIRAFSKTPLPITKIQAQVIGQYHAKLMEANRHMNLTAVSSDEQAIVLHYIDSAAPLFLGWIPTQSRCIDVGTGAGLPGIVLAILRPDCTFVLMDSLQKRIRFLKNVIEALHLTNATAIHMRAEDAGQSTKYRETFDIVLSRAVASLPVLCEYCLPLAKVGGCMITYKGPGLEGELTQAHRAMQLLGAHGYDIADAATPGRNHTLARIHKTHPTPTDYPRKAGIPIRKPLV